jgi:hypothetical protein
MASSRELGSLRRKYERMLALRREHERARLEGRVEPAPRRRLARLAEEFPGALREIDRLPVEVITARIAALASAERGRSRTAPWMEAQLLFHRLARGALAAKRWLRGRKRIDDSTRAAFDAALPTMPRGADARAFASELHRIAAPPRGRLMDLVYARVAAVLGVTDDEARALVAGPNELTSPRRKRTTTKMTTRRSSTKSSTKR